MGQHYEGLTAERLNFNRERGDVVSLKAGWPVTARLVGARSADHATFEVWKLTARFNFEIVTRYAEGVHVIIGDPVAADAAKDS